MEDFGSTQASVSSALVSMTRAVSQVAEEDVAFHRSLDPSLGALLDKQNSKLLRLASRLMRTATADTETVRAPSLKDVDDIETNWRTVVDVVDSLLERADTTLDEFAGAVRRLSPGAIERAAAAAAATAAKPTTRHSRYGVQAPRAQAMEKPQLLFDHTPDNKTDALFVPLLSNKPHAITPLATQPISHASNPSLFYPHPYQLEIEQYQYPSEIYTQSEPIHYRPFDTTTATFVDTEELLDEMLQELKQAKEIAIDLEHHDQRSYVGIVCLMQISTRDRDWIVDTLVPWRRKLNCLNEVFADPSVIKVLHGAYMDIVWLQRDLGLYIVGLFDTYHAARALGYPGASLAYLLKRFVDFDAQKQYQMADWRVRPLPQELFNYARSDTHYLLYIFDCMRNELIEHSDFSLADNAGDKIRDVLQKSKESALQRYETHVYDTELGQGSMGWYKLLSRTPVLFSKEQFAVFRAVHKWRDTVAREQDDSIGWILPNHNLFAIAREMPTNKAAILGVVQPNTQTVRLRVDELLAVVLKAKETGSEGPDMNATLRRIGGFDEEPPPLNLGSNNSTSQRNSAADNPSEVLANYGGEIVQSLRSMVSSFWGNAFKNSTHQVPTAPTAATDISLTIPAAAVTADMLTENPQIEPSASPTVQYTPMQTEPETSQPTDVNTDEDLIVLKQLGQKRKRVELPSTDAMATQSDEVALSDQSKEQLDKIAARKEAKKARRAEKLARRQAANGNPKDERNSEEEKPFDYASAPSMLNPPMETKEEMQARKKKEVNPYARSTETQKGLPRVQKERAGKTMSYR